MNRQFTLSTKKRFLLVNPYACDFACYDYWLKPLGLLYISSILKSYGHETVMVDCLHRRAGPQEYGKGRLDSQETIKPGALKTYPRKYSNYGIFGEKLYNILKRIKTPDMILLSTSMTYWYPAAAETARILRDVFPGVKIAAGGTYITLCPGHARENIDADYFFEGAELRGFFDFIGENYMPFNQWPSPDYSCYETLDYAVTRTSAGCARGCPYCGISRIWKGFFTRKPGDITEEFNYYYSLGIRDMAFYDDALLENPFLLESLGSLPGKIRIHTPNGINPRLIDWTTADLLKKSCFLNPVIAADTLGSAGRPKNSKKEIERAAESLYRAGYRRGEISAYLIMGLPGHSLQDFLKEAVFLNKLGIRVLIAEYAVVPGCGYDEIIAPEVLNEPLLHNNSIFPCIDEGRENISAIKVEIARRNNSLSK